jgi:transforming growth factor-beta-induced protein
MNHVLRHFLPGILTCLSVVFLGTLFSCEEEDIAQIEPGAVLGDPNSLYNQASNNENLSTFLDAAEKGGFTLALREGEDIPTVFAPSNEAFAAAGIDLSSLSQDDLERILNYHTIPDSLPAAALTTERYQTNSGKFIDLTVDGGNVVIEPNTDAARVTTADIIGSNGFIHIIDKVLSPPRELSQIVGDTDDLSLLNEAIGRFPDLVSAVEGFDTDLTVFAPTNTAFEAFLAQFPQYESLEEVPDQVLLTILQYHLVGEELFSGAVTGELETLQGESIVAGNVAPALVTTDINASNGVAHVINQVLVPPSVSELVGTVLGTAYFDSEARFTTLVEAVDKAGLRSTLLAAGPFTVFAPTDDAFEAANFKLGDYEENDPALQSVLLYHVVGGASVNAAGLVEGALTMANGEQSYVDLNDAGSFVNASEIVLADLASANGIVHAVDAPLMPPMGNNIVQTAAGNASFGILAEALTIAGLTDTLATAGPFTVFAPTNAAFQALFTDLGVSDIAELTAEQLRPILLYHVTNGRTFSFQINDGVQVPTLNPGTDFIINEQRFPQPPNEDEEPVPDVVEISIVQPGDDAALLLTDVVTTNGLIHAIDKVLLP